MKKNMMLCIDLTTMLQKDALPETNMTYRGVLTLDDNFHACFVEQCHSGSHRRNVRVFDGKRITVTYRPRDGFTRFNFKNAVVGPGFNAEAFAREVAREICIACNGLVEK